MPAMFTRMLFTLASVLITACTGPTFPTNEPLPYSQGEFSGVILTNKHDDVAAHLGRPQLRLEGDQLWVYGRSRIKSSGFGRYNHDYRAMLVEFKNGEVVAKKVFHEKYLFRSGCWGSDNALCLHPAWDTTSGEYDEPQILSRRYSSVTSARQDDEKAKTFTPHDGHCAIYVYTNTSFFEDKQTPPTLTLGTILDEPIPSAGYIYIESVPSLLHLRSGSSTMDIECEAQALHFYQLDHTLFNAQNTTRIKPVDSETGKKAVLQRRLLLNWH